DRPAPGARILEGVPVFPAVREVANQVMMVMERDADLFEVVGARGPVRRLAYLLHGGQEQSDQDADDGNDDQQFDQGKPAPPERCHTTPPCRILSLPRPGLTPT